MVYSSLESKSLCLVRGKAPASARFLEEHKLVFARFITLRSFRLLFSGISRAYVHAHLDSFGVKAISAITLTSEDQTSQQTSCQLQTVG